MDNETRSAFADLKAYIGQQTHQLDQRIGGLEKHVGSLDKRVEVLELEGSDLNVRLIDQFRAIDRRFDGNDRRFDAIDRRLDGIDSRFEGLADEITGRVISYLAVILEEQKAANKAFRDEMRGHKGVLDDHETRLEHLETPPPRPGTSTAA